MDKAGEFIGNDFKDYCTQTEELLEYASTNTRQQHDISERIGGMLAAIVPCMLADSGLPTFFWGRLIFTAGYVELQPRVYARCRKITFTRPARGKCLEQRRQATFADYHGQRNVPQIDDSLRQLVRRQSAGAGDV